MSPIAQRRATRVSIGFAAPVIYKYFLRFPQVEGFGLRSTN